MLLLFFFSLLKLVNNGIPLWFRCFKGKRDPESYKTSLIIEGISYANNLFKDKKCNIIFLADRWFTNYKIMKYIDSTGATYCIRTKTSISTYIYECEELIGYISEIKPKTSEEQYFNNILITKNKYRTKLAVSKLDTHKEGLYILTNGDTRKAIEYYGYRFGSIEFVFKNQKSNGFYLESTKMRNIQSFTTMFGLMCVALLWLTILGVEYCKNEEKCEGYLKIRCYKNNKKERAFSFFNTGLLFFNLAFNSRKRCIIKCDFLL